MRSQLFKSNANGQFRALGSGRGFRIAPAVPANSDPRASTLNVPGSLPLRVQLDGTGEWHHYGACDVHFPGEHFGFLDVDGAYPNVWFVVQMYELNEGMVPGAKQRVPVTIAAAGTAVPNATPPASGSDGWGVRPGSQNITFYAGGTPRVCDLWVRSAAGVWYDTGVDLDFTLEAVQTRFVDLPGDRLALNAAGAAMTVEVDASMEVG